MITYIGDQIRILPLANPDPPDLLRGGASGSTTYGYRVVAVRDTGQTLPSSEATLTSGFSSLDTTHYIDVTPGVVSRATAFYIFRTTGEATQGFLGVVIPQVLDGVQIAKFRDTGQAAEAIALPTENTTGTLALTGLAPGTVLYVGDNGQLTTVPAGTTGQVLTLGAELPVWADATGGTPAEQIYPTSARMWLDEATAVIGDFNITPTGPYGGTEQPYGFFVENGPTPAIGDSFSWSFLIAAGSYTLYILGIKGDNRGQINWYLDEVLITSAQEWYDAGILFNTRLSIVMDIDTSGLHTIRASISGKNVSSTNYFYLLTKLTLLPTPV